MFLCVIWRTPGHQTVEVLVRLKSKFIDRSQADLNCRTNGMAWPYH